MEDETLKLSEAVQIDIRMEITPDKSVYITIRDSGLGILPKEQQHIFDRFYRGDPGRSTGEGSIGLGLSIARWVVEINDGRIEVESQPGRRNTFSVILPPINNQREQ